MGLEARTICHTLSQSYEVKALLESRELILRGGLKLALPISELCDVTGDERGLRFRAGDEVYRLELDPIAAAKWARKISTPPPSLGAKLGLVGDIKAFVWGTSDDTELNLALSGHQTETAPEMVILIAHTPEELAQGLSDLSAVIGRHPVWIIHPKGAKSPLTDTAIRHHMRMNGFTDSKSCAVSEVLTATRYRLKK